MFNWKLNPYPVGKNTDRLLFSVKQEKGRWNLAVSNQGEEAARLKEILLYQGGLPVSASGQFYGDGKNMLSQYGGTVGQPQPLTGLTDNGHYRFAQKEGMFTVYNYALFSERGEHFLFGFSSCRRFSGEIRFSGSASSTQALEIALDLENLELQPGETWELEELCLFQGENREALLAEFGEQIQKNHPALPVREVPTGWCSWYCFGPRVTKQDIFANLDSLQKKGLPLQYVQIDDGYQAAMGDWLLVNQGFSGGVKPLFDQIREKGFEPAIWVAPFIAQADSRVFQEHPDWFVMDENGSPLDSSKKTFGGWRHGPWYMLDGTNPEACAYLEMVFHTMRQEWGCRYFKLDANMWGAMPFGLRWDNTKTSVEAYRQGMEAVRRGAGEDSFLLGCNAPMWPSLGTVHGMRVTGDIKRDWKKFTSLARECFYRNWQNGRLWINDPDCLTVENLQETLVSEDGKISTQQKTGMSEEEFTFHATYLFASGGMVLSGDNLAQNPLEHTEWLQILMEAPKTAAVFEDTSFEVGKIPAGENCYYCLFNWGEAPKALKISLDRRYRVQELWSRQDFGEKKGDLVLALKPRSGMVLQCKKA